MEYLIIILIMLIIHPYTTYPLFLYFVNKVIKPTEDKLSLEYSPTITLLVAAYNEEKVIGQKIENALGLKVLQEKIQIVIGSDGSNDKTNAIVRSYAQKYSNIKLLDYKQRRGKVNVINESIKHCDGDIIILSDANAMYNNEAICNIIPHFQDSKVGCVAGEKKMMLASKNDNIGQNEGLYWKLESFIKTAESQFDTVIGADGALYAIRKSLFQQLPENTSVDDFLLSMLIVKQGYKIEYEPNAYSYELSGQTLEVEFRRKVRIAAGNFFNLKFLTCFLGVSLRSFLFISHKFLRWISPFIFILLTILLVAMQRQNLVYQIIYISLLGSYIIAITGYYFRNGFLKNNKTFSFVTHFYLTVLAQLYGFIKFLNKSQKAFWDTARQ